MPRRWVLDESDHPTRHELRSTYRCGATGHLGNRHHAPASRDLHPPTSTSGFYFVSTHVATCIDDDLDAITFHVLLNVQLGAASPCVPPIVEGTSSSSIRSIPPTATDSGPSPCS